jgi:hypothetical protein
MQGAFSPTTRATLYLKRDRRHAIHLHRRDSSLKQETKNGKKERGSVWIGKNLKVMSPLKKYDVLSYEPPLNGGCDIKGN